MVRTLHQSAARVGGICLLRFSLGRALPFRLDPVHGPYRSSVSAPSAHVQRALSEALLPGSGHQRGPASAAARFHANAVATAGAGSNLHCRVRVSRCAGGLLAVDVFTRAGQV
uniref:(northern house mosquito) hypothetical protein n=1 Tax=Culex pipiens TaxID=7175 RepID=A0A8D8G7B5_CULPI